MYDIKNLNIWKQDSQINKQLTKNPIKEIQGLHGEILIYQSSILLDVNIEFLNLSVRSFNCLKRTGWDTIGDIVKEIENWQDLLKVRNLGRNSAEEILRQIQKYQESLLTPKDKEYQRKSMQRSIEAQISRKEKDNQDGFEKILTLESVAV